MQELSLVSTAHYLSLTSYIALSQVKVSVTSVTNAVGLRALIASRVDLALLVSLLLLVCMTCQWSLDTSMSSWFATVMHPTPLTAKNRRRVVPMLPALTTRTDDDRSLCWPNMPNPSKSRSWWDYREV